MNGSTLIASYLWKDIWRQWRTNWISVTARLAVAVFLFGLALSLDVYFAGSERALSRELERVGPSRAVLTHFAFGEQKDALDGTIGPRLRALQRDGALVHLKRFPGQAEVEILGGAAVLAYHDLELRELQHFLPEIEGGGAFLLTDRSEIPGGTKLQAFLDESDLSLTVLRVPSTFLGMLGARKVVLMPLHRTESLRGNGFVETVLYESRSWEVPTIAREISILRQWLELDGFSGVTLQSGLEVLQRLERLREQQALWSVFVRSLVAGLVVLVFAACAFLEYRENAYLSALLQSMGVSRGFLLLRYLVEHSALLVLGFLMAAAAMELLLGRVSAIEAMTGSAPGELFALRDALGDWWAVLSVTVFFSVTPVWIGLRKEIGRVLQ